MNIGIYDGDIGRGNQIKAVIENYINQILEEAKVVCFQKREEINAALETFPNVLFINLDMDGEGGIRLAQDLNEMKRECQIVYYAESLKMVPEVYKTNHIYFVLQKQFSQRLEEIFHKIRIGINQRRERFLFIEIGGNKIFLLSDEIIYFERIKRVTRIVTIHGIYEIREKLNDIIERLPDREFVRCHNSYIVCISSVREVMKDCLVMINGEKVMVSRSYMKAVREKFTE